MAEIRRFTFWTCDVESCGGGELLTGRNTGEPTCPKCNGPMGADLLLAEDVGALDRAAPVKVRSLDVEDRFLYDRKVWEVTFTDHRCLEALDRDFGETLTFWSKPHPGAMSWDTLVEQR